MFFDDMLSLYEWCLYFGFLFVFRKKIHVNVFQLWSKATNSVPINAPVFLTSFASATRFREKGIAIVVKNFSISISMVQF